MGAVAKSYMMRALVIYGLICSRSLLDFLIFETNFKSLFYQCKDRLDFE
jgi:hypothetical protein